MKVEYKDALEAVKNCSSERLPIVIDILRNAGYEFSPESICAVLSSKKARAERAAMSRVEKVSKWGESDDEAVNLLRKAYASGISFTSLSNHCCIGRAALYHYMNEERAVPSYCREKIKESVLNLLNQ